jgi:antitoxin MazE
MLKKLTRHGNSWALVVDKPMLEALKISENTILEISTDGKELKVKPSHGKSRREHLDDWLAIANKRYAKVMKALSSPEK